MSLVVLSATLSLAKSPLLAEWKGPHGGVPPFDQVKTEEIGPALEAAIEDYRRELKAIGDSKAPATFANTIVALEKAGQPYTRVRTIYSVWSSSMKSPEFQKVEQAMAPKLAAFRDEITHDPKLWQRIEAVYAAADKLKPEDRRLAWLYYTQFAQEGAKLGEADKAKMSEINQKLAGLYTQFGQNLLADEEAGQLVIDNVKDLAGLPQSQINDAAEEATRRNLKGKWVIANSRSSMEPFLTYASNRALREKGFTMWTHRGDNGDAHDNNAIVAQIVKLRNERAKLLGYPTYAHWHLADTMAKEPQATMDLMLKVWKPAVAQVKKDVLAMQAIVDADKGGFPIKPWDYRYYAEKVRKAKYDLDLGEVTPYLQLDKLREAMFWVAGELYGLHFKQVQNLPVFHPSMSVYEVTGRDSKHVGYWYFDPYARPGKASGAWMNAYREQSTIKGNITTIVSNNSNFNQGKAGEPVLISWDDARTLFHEFGHALHGLLSDSNYPSLSGTNTARDFVEFPSQFAENYLRTPQVQKMLVNVKGEQIPAELIAKIEKAATFNEGFRTTEFLASAIVDMKMHLTTDAAVEPKSFETGTLTELGMPKEIVMRHRIPQFAHLFTDEGYAAGYYGYLWAEVLDHDAYEAFVEAGSPYDKKTAERLVKTLFKVGNTVDPAEAYRAFRGRDPNVSALLKARGLDAASATN